jgi:peptide methionine sulfoxide reductase MsrA
MAGVAKIASELINRQIPHLIYAQVDNLKTDYPKVIQVEFDLNHLTSLV